jgi:proteic killer suppression protein
VILGYRDKRTRDFAFGKRVKAFSSIESPARLKLDRLQAAVTLRDLAVLPGNRFEALKGKRKGRYSIQSMTSAEFASTGGMVRPARRA